MEQIALPLEPVRRVFTVGELNAAVRDLFETAFHDIWVAGEISGVRIASSGHTYFTLKERDAQLRCVCFRSICRYLKFKPQDGVAVVARGRLDVYEARGEYQLLVEFLEPQGHGALQFAYEQLKKKLAAEGLFDPARKRPLPRYPRRIGIVTSSSGAVIRDMINILERRFPGLHIRLYPALVQGEGSVNEVCRALTYFSLTKWPDVVIVARGGGSLEDLWTFNEEAVARAIAASSVPVVSAIGHETDVTIADFAADMRAPTPSAAAEMVIRTREQVLDQIEGSLRKATQAVRYQMANAGRALNQVGIERVSSLLHRRMGRLLQRADDLDYQLKERSRLIIETRRAALLALADRLRRRDLRLQSLEFSRRLDRAQSAATHHIRSRISRAYGRLEPLAAQLHQLSPLRVLDRGYAIVEDEAGRVVKEAAAITRNSAVRIRLARGRLKARVTESIPEMDGSSRPPA